VAAAGGGVPHGGRAGGVEDCGRVLAPLVISGELVGEVARAPPDGGAGKAVGRIET